MLRTRVLALLSGSKVRFETQKTSALKLGGITTRACMASETARKNESISVTTRLQQAPQGAKAGDKDGCSHQHSEHGKDEHAHQYSD